jgi:hypothetical protein
VCNSFCSRIINIQQSKGLAIALLEFVDEIFIAKAGHMYMVKLGFPLIHVDAPVNVKAFRCQMHELARRRLRLWLYHVIISSINKGNKESSKLTLSF